MVGLKHFRYLLNACAFLSLFRVANVLGSAEVSSAAQPVAVPPTSGGGALFGAASASDVGPGGGVDLGGFYHPTSTTWDDQGHVYVAEKVGKV